MQASGLGPLQYQWFDGSTSINGAVGSTLTIPSVSSADDGQGYSVQVSNALGTTTSISASLHLLPPQVITWTGAVSSAWFDYGNWDDGDVPTSADNIVISGGTATLTSDSSFLGLTLNGGSLAWTINAATTMVWTGGTLGGVLSVASRATLDITGNGGQAINQNATLNNAGTIVQSDPGQLVLSPDAVINNLSGGDFQLVGDGGFGYANGGPYADPNYFNNAGLLVKSSGVGTSDVGGYISGYFQGAVTFSNTGTIEADSGTLTLSGIWNNSRTFSEINSTLILGGNTTTGIGTVDSSSGVIVVGALSFIGGRPLDAHNSDLIIHNADPAAVTALIAAGYNGGGWNGSTGITSSTAASASNTALAVELNKDSSGNVLLGTFDGQTVTNTDVLVKYTYYGDGNLDGVVSASDYIAIDNGFNNRLTGWNSGDFNYDGVVNGDDYTLIDNAFNSQAASPLPAVAGGSTPLTPLSQLFASNQSLAAAAPASKAESTAPVAAGSLFSQTSAINSGPSTSQSIWNNLFDGDDSDSFIIPKPNS